MKSWVLLDSQSILGIFCNPKLTKFILVDDKWMILAQNLITNQKSIVPGYGEMCFKENTMQRGITPPLIPPRRVYLLCKIARDH
jgi:hypothetical protein